MSKVTITINNDGKVLTQVHGAPGKTCLKETEGLDVYFGNPEHRQFTPEYHQSTTTSQQEATND